MQGKKPVKVQQYTYASGRIRALEIQLLDSSRLNRLYEARTVEDVGRILAESGYPAAPDPETSLAREMIETYELMKKLFPDLDFLAAMLLFHDFHNLKVVLKTLTAFWPQRKAGEESEDAGIIPEASSLASYQSCESLFQLPSLIDPHVLFQAIRDRQPELIPEWLYSAAIQAVRFYQSTYDISDIDLTLDRAAFGAAFDHARQLKNDFFCQYLTRRVDLINLGLLLRTRFLRSGTAYLEQAVIAGGSIAPEKILELYHGSTEQILKLYASTPFEALAGLAETYGQPGTATRFSLLADNLIIEQIRTARWILRGPEILLAYVFGREMEIKNVRIILTCLRNNLPASQAREMVRDSYLTWR